MYNVKYFKYPSGWQVRVYDTIVGYKEKPDKLYNDEDPEFYPLWDMNEQEYYYERLRRKDDIWENPFTMIQEKAPKEWTVEDEEKKKKRSLASSMGRTVNAIYRTARANTWDWFITLTLNPVCVDSFDYEASVKKLSKWLNHIKTSFPDIGYIVVPEKHESGRFHFHGLMKNCDGLNFTPSGLKDKKGNLIYNIGKYRLGWTTATKINDQSRVTKYIAKYINKDLCQVAFGKKRYWCSRNLQEPDITEVVLDWDKQQQLVSRLEQVASYIKTIENSEVITTYYELPEGVCDEDW